VFAKPRAAGALIQIKKGHPESLDWLLDRLKSDRPLERATAASALGRLGPYGKPAVAKLLERLEDQDSTVRVLAACSLWQLTLEPSRILPVLQGALGDANAEVKLSPDGVWATHPTQRQLAAFYLGGMGPAARPAVPDLIGVLKDKDRVLRSRVLDALGSIQLRTPEVYQALKAQTDDADPKIAAKAAEVLKRLGGG
jgi:HEAT repeat protein